MSDAPRVNGNQYEWGSIEAKIAGELYYGITAVNFKQARERTLTYGQGKHHAPRGKTRGKYSAEGSIEMAVSTAESIRKALATAHGDSNYGDQEFDIVVQYSEPGSTEEPLKVEMLRCTIASEDNGHSEGTDALMETWELTVMWIKKNDRTLFQNDGFI